MKPTKQPPLKRVFCALVFFLAASIAQAGLSLEVHFFRTAHAQYYSFYTPLSTNALEAAPAFGVYTVNSPQWPASGSTRQFLMNTNGLNVTGGSETEYPDFDTAMQQVTNGLWTLIFTNGTTSNVYTFTVSAPDMTTNLIPPTIITYPADGQSDVPNQPTFIWVGPTDWLVDNNTYVYNPDFSFFQYASLPASQESWADPNPITTGLTCTFEVQYITNDSPLIFTTTTPTNAQSNPFPDWTSTDAIETVDQVNFTVSSGPDFNSALNTTGLDWSTSGDTSWFVETTNTFDGVSAAESGIVTNNQSSTLTLYVTGPGTLTFFWASIDNDPNGGFDYEFYMDDPDTGDEADINGDNSWSEYGPFDVPAGQHTLNWALFANGDTDTNDAAFLDEVSYIPDTPPVITSNPISQTNYSGYAIWLSASASGTPAPTLQWYFGGNPIAGATATYYIPTNSGTAAAAGDYYAIASNPVGTATTLTALVTYVTAPLPPNWSLAVKSPFSAAQGTNVISDYYGGCAVDSAGDVYVADEYEGSVNVETNFVTINTLTSAGTYGAAALVKYATNGKPVWAVGLTNNQPTSYSYGLCVAPAPDDGAYLSAILIGTNWLGTNQFSNVAGQSVLLARFDATGSNIWSRFLGTNATVFTTYNSLVSDSSGNVTIIGSISGTVDFGGTILTTSGFEGFIAQYNSSGVLQWARILPDLPVDIAYGSAQLYLSIATGTYNGSTSLAIGALSNLTDRAYGIAALNSTNGQPLWLQAIGEQFGANQTGLQDDYPLISVSGSDVFVIGTAHSSPATFGGLSVPITGGRGQYFARYDTNGNPQVASSFGNATTMPWASAADSSGVYVSGDFDDYSYFDNDLIAAPEYYTNDLGSLYFSQPFVAKFDANGNALWALNGVASDEANFRGVATAPDGVWASGFDKTQDANAETQFGTNVVSSDGYLYYFGDGVIFFFTEGGLLTKITESASSPAGPTPVTLLDPQIVGTNFLFSFQSESGRSHIVQSQTNLGGIWVSNMTVVGDGTVKQISLPLPASKTSHTFFRVDTQ